MRKLKLMGALFLLAACVCSSCEKANLGDDGDEPEPENGVRIELRISRFEQVAFDGAQAKSRAATEVSELCSRLTFAIFDAGGSRVKSVSQTSTDKSFGTFGVSLPQGSYRVVVIAHSGNGSVSVTDPEKIKFPDNKVTDTFYCCEDIEVTDAKSYALELRRAVAMFRLVITDDVPASVKRFKFYYTGGSSTLNAVTGRGCVDSRQTEYREVTAEMAGKPCQLDVFTFPHADEGELKMTVTALDAAGTTVAEKLFEAVPVQLGWISKYSGAFFNGTTQTGDITFTLSADGNWQEITHSY